MKHKKLTALILCFTMLFSITSGIFSAALAADSTTGSAYHLDTTTGSAITGSGLWGSTTESAYKADKGIKLFSTKAKAVEVAEETPVPDYSAYAAHRGMYATFSEDGYFEAVPYKPTTFKDGGEAIVYSTGNFSEDILFKVTDYTVVHDYYDVTDEDTGAVTGVTTISSLWYQLDIISGEATGTEEGGTLFQKGFWVFQNYLAGEEAYEYDTLTLFAPEVGKIVQFNTVTPILYKKIGETDKVGVDINKLNRMVIEEVTTVGDTTWYYVVAADGAWPEEYTGYHYVKANMVEVVEQEEATNPCAICGETNCKIAHLYCEICGEFDCGQTHSQQIGPTITPVIPENPTLTEGADVSIVDEYGNAVTEEGLFLAQGIRSSISAWSELESNANVSYQWQICYDTKNDLWVDIQGQSGKGMLISPAMVQSVIDLTGVAIIRCEITSGETVQYSAEIPVEVLNDTPLMARFGLTRNVDDVMVSDVSSGSNMYTVRINYIFDSNEATAVGSYIANLAKGSNFYEKVTHPTIVGYLPYVEDTPSTQIKFDITGIAADVTYEVRYKPTLVDYTVIHYQQNAYNDSYTQVLVETKKALTGTTLEAINDPIEKAYEGFYALLFDESEKIMADGSTVVEVYYDRFYYLMKFELDGGYGVAPIYARYGDTVKIGTPIKPGYQFNGWKDVNGNKVTEIPKTIPIHGVTYYADWIVADTTYTVAYWIQNDDSTTTSIGSKIVEAQSGTTVSGIDDMDVETNVCGLPEHSHTSSCELTCPLPEHSTHDGISCMYTCGNSSHDHSDCTCRLDLHIHQASCYSCQSVEHTHTADCKADLAKYVDFVSAQKDVVVKGDGSTVVNVYYKYRTYTIRFIYARKDGDWNYKVATSTSNGNLNNCSWSGDSMYIGNLPSVTGYASAEVKIGYYTYYYISLTAKFGEDITDKWPDANIGNAGGYRWGSWAAAAGTGYRKKYGDAHANIIGPYPVMSADMIVDNPEKLSDGTYLAQNMIAWWGGYGDNIATHSYHNYFEVLPGEDQTGAVEYGGKYYKLAKTFTFTAAHNNTTRVDPIYFNGYKCINDTRGTSNDRQANSSNFNNQGRCSICGTACSYCNKFYYDRNMHKLYFWNFNGMLDDGVGIEIPYGAPLSSYGTEKNNDYMKGHYPADMKPGAYQFAGWYTTADCSAEVVWNTATMPDADMTVYAKYVPVTHYVNYYLTRDSLTRGEIIPVEMARLVAALPEDTRPTVNPYATAFIQEEVEHGDYIENLGDPEVTEGYQTIHPRAGYEFIGWFYLNEDDEETAFDPANMPVTQDLNLYGKWSSNVLQEYSVYFKYKDENGEEIEIADPIEGSAPAGTNKTIEAKGGMDLYEGYRTGYFPKGNKYDVTLNIGTDNTYTFWYVQKAAVPYSVYYVTESPKAGVTQGSVTLDGKTYYILASTKTVSNNRQAIITENFVAVNGYVPDAYQKRLVLDADNSDNKIIFLYSVNTTQAYYKITHYIEDTNHNSENISEYTWTEYASSQILDTIGTTHTADPMAITGFTYNAAAPNTLTSGELTAAGLELKLYYTRNEYPYEIRYLEDVTGKQLAEPKNKDAFGNVLTGKYGQVISERAIGIDNYTPNSTSKTLNISIEESSAVAKRNIITFYYAENEATINYVVVGPAGCGTINSESETVKVVSAANAVGATATANTNYRFVGWYSDATCENQVSTTAKYIPTKSGDIWTSATYYAKFELDIADLTITKSGWESIDENQSFLFTVTGPNGFTLDVVIHGNGSVTIKDLLIGQYTVTEKTNWSWRYTDTPDWTFVTDGDTDASGENNAVATITLGASGNVITFTNDRSKIYWLDGGTWCDNLFDGANTTDTPYGRTKNLSIAFADIVLREETTDDDELTVQLA